MLMNNRYLKLECQHVINNKRFSKQIVVWNEARPSVTTSLFWLILSSFDKRTNFSSFGRSQRNRKIGAGVVFPVEINAQRFLLLIFLCWTKFQLPTKFYKNYFVLQKISQAHHFVSLPGSEISKSGGQMKLSAVYLSTFSLVKFLIFHVMWRRAKLRFNSDDIVANFDSPLNFNEQRLNLFSWAQFWNYDKNYVDKLIF